MRRRLQLRVEQHVGRVTSPRRNLRHAVQPVEREISRQRNLLRAAQHVGRVTSLRRNLLRVVRLAEQRTNSWAVPVHGLPSQSVDNGLSGYEKQTYEWFT